MVGEGRRLGEQDEARHRSCPTHGVSDETASVWVN